VDFVYILGIIMVLSFFGISAMESPIEIGVLYAFINYLERFFEPINHMMQRLSLLQQAVVSSQRVFELLDNDELAPQAIGNEKPVIEKGSIEFKNVSFSYDR